MEFWLSEVGGGGNGESLVKVYKIALIRLRFMDLMHSMMPIVINMAFYAWKLLGEILNVCAPQKKGSVICVNYSYCGSDFAIYMHADSLENVWFFLKK